MGKKRSRGEIEKALAESRRALPFGIAFAVIGCGGVWGIRQWLHAPQWAAVLPVLALPVGQALNIVYCRWALRRLDSGET